MYESKDRNQHCACGVYRGYGGILENPQEESVGRNLFAAVLGRR